jgi:hypothetical protein
MWGKFILVLLFTVIIGIQPALAQSKTEAPAKPAAPAKPVKESETVININLASDKEFSQALEAAGEIELVDEETAKSDIKKPDEKSDKSTNQRKSSDKK